MVSTESPVADTTRDMAKNKPAENRKTPRVTVAIPEEWHAIARRLAAKRRQPVLYLLITALQKEAEEEGITDLPAPPWESED